MIDGFPKNLEQAMCFEKTYGKIEHMVHFDCEEATLVKRLSQDNRQEYNEKRLNVRKKSLDL